MSESVTKRSTVLEQLLKKAPQHEPEVEGAIEAFQEARARSRESMMLSLRLVNGTVESFPYSYLTRVRFIPGDTITLRFGAAEVQVTGRNLDRLCETITEQRTRWIQEGAEGEDGLKEPHQAHVDGIVITEGEEI